MNKRSTAFRFSADKVRGLNIRGWLVLEPWITPSIFEAHDPSLGIVDEYILTDKLGMERASKILKSHWDAFVRLSDFQRIEDAGFNLVRIPIGYWAFGLLESEPYTPGAAQYLDTAIGWARNTSLKVLIDLHGAPGSQNWFDHSGHRLARPGWQSGNNVEVTLEVLKIISTKYAAPEYEDVIAGIELLNEPLSSMLDYAKLRQFYQDGYNQTRETGDTPVIIHDAFIPPQNWDILDEEAPRNLIVDHHEYQCFSNELLTLSPAQHIQLVCDNTHTWTSKDKYVVIGDFSSAMTDCATYINGYRTKSRFDGTYPHSEFLGSCEPWVEIAAWTPEMRRDVIQYLEAQIDAYEKNSAGWIFTNFKTERRAAEWSAFDLLDAKIFPVRGGRQFPPVCEVYPGTGH